MSLPAAQMPEPALASLLDARRLLVPFFEAKDLARGLEYAMHSRGEVVGVRGAAGTIEIAGRCRGSAPRPYQQSVTLELSPSGAIEGLAGLCDCPVEVQCKHVACVALVWLCARSPGAASAQAPMPARRPPAPRHEHLSLDVEAKRWLEAVESAFAPLSEGDRAGECVAYALFDEGRRMEIRKARRAKDGRLSLAKGMPDLGWLYDDRRPPRYLTAGDVAVYRALGRLTAARHGGEWELRGESGREAVECALRTGRLLVELEDTSSGEVSFLTRGAPMTAAPTLVSSMPGLVRWGARDADGRLVHALPLVPPMYLDQAAREIGDLDTGLAASVAAAIFAMPEVPTEEAPVLLSRLAHVARAHHASNVAAALPPQLLLETGAPRPRLRFTGAELRQYHRGQHRRVRHWIAELWFDYEDGLSVSEDSPEAAATHWTDASGAPRVTLRDQEAEAAARQELNRAGFPVAASWHWREDARRPFMMAGDGSDAAWRQAGPTLVEVAQRIGAQVECDPDFPYRVREAEDVYEALDTAGGSGWFELELGVLVEGKRVPIGEALADWIRRTPDPQAWLDRADAATPVVLNAGVEGLIRIPAARLRELVAPLLETFAFERDSREGRLRLSRVEAAMLAEPDSGQARHAALADLTLLRERLRDFRGIAPAAPAPGFTAHLRPYQQQGLDWLQFLRECGLAGILADDMGLGKTVQALAHLTLEKAAGRADRPSLVVAPTSVLPNWREEAQRFAPRLRVLVLHGARRAEEHARIADADLVITSYPLLARDAEVLARHEYHLAIFDEAQFLKNARTQARAAAAALRARHRLALTGTPVENNLSELWSHFDLLLPGFLGDSKQFARAWRGPIERGGDSARMARLSRRVRPFLLRRTRDEVLAELPRKTEIVRHVELRDAQRDLYESLRLSLDRKLRSAIAAKGFAGSQITILDALLKLRQACCDPRLVKSPRAAAAATHSAKLDALREMVAELLAEGRRTLLFSQFTSMLDLIEPELDAIGARRVRLDGSTADRLTPVKRFQSGEADVFLISLRAGGTGLNLTAADTVIHYDPWWNPAVEAQATARAHRIGQDKAVFVYRLIALGTVEERIEKLVARKRALAEALLGEGRSGKGAITEEDVRMLLAPIGEAS